MRILAVRGSNLASLQRFDIDFESGPLAGAGLFAITGPTGAGKSTLLDALCLALYGRTPRLGGRSDTRIADAGEPAELGVSDPRALLRRGAASGFAEVDFAGSDGRRYRSRWSVRRARKRATGKLQKVDIELCELDSGRVLAGGKGGRKTEALEEIERRLGLSFDQFRRSVLLAQGDFAAFLRADRNERADLLERMTGTEIYGRISMAAHRRAAEEAAALGELRARVQALALLSPEEREALGVATEAAAMASQRAELELAEADAACRYHSELAALEKAQAQADLDAGRAHEMRRSLDAEEARLAQVRRALELSPLRRRALELREPRSRAGDDAAASRRQLAALERQREDAQRAVQGAEEARAAVATRLAEDRPRIDEARRIEAALATAEDGLRTAESRAEAALAEALRAESEQRQLDENQQRARRRQGELVAWIDARGGLGDVAGDWSRWRELLGRYRKVSVAEDEAAERERRCASRLAERRQISDREQALEEQALQELEAARHAADAARERAAELPQAEVRAAIDACRAESDWLRERREHAAAAAAAVLARERALAEINAAREALAAEGDGSELRRQHEVVAAALGEAEAGLARLQLAIGEDVHALRAQLEDGEPCPVCGGCEHPYADSAPARSALDTQKERVFELRGQLRAVDVELGTQKERMANQRAALVRAEGRARETETELARIARAWEQGGETPAGQPELPVERPDDPETLTWLERRLELLADRSRALAADEARAAKLAAEHAACTDRVSARHSDLEQRRTARAAADAARSAAELEHRRAADALEAARDERTSLERELEPVFECAGGRDVGALGKLASDVEELLERRERVAQLDQELEASARARQALTAELERRRGEARAATEARDVARRAVADRRRERLAALGGKTVAEAESELEAATRQAAEALSAAHRRLAEIDSARAAAVERSAAAEREHRRLTTELAEAEADLDAALRERAMTREQLDATLAVGGEAGPAAWIAGIEDRLKAADGDLTRTRAVAEERRRAVAELRAKGAPAIAPERAGELRDRAAGYRDEARERLAELRARQRQDDRARTSSAELEADIAACQQRAGTYAALRELIGSADGRKFRVFAQSLTLDALIAQANAHLNDLMNRYRLQRIPGLDLELQIIDRHMGDEVRSVQSLSGGESFLVSLALALGLSSLSSQDTRIESLLIDEGFGTLDADTLDVALSVLDTLQAHGRTVGLISHVPGMAERVGVRIHVQPRGGGCSDVNVVG